MRSKKEKDSKNGIMRRVVRLICLVGIAVCLLLWGAWQMRNRRMLSRQDAAAGEIRAAQSGTDNAAPESENQTVSAASPTAAPESSVSAAENTAETEQTFPEVVSGQATNPEVVGTLEFGEDQLMYFVQASDNDFYLTHSWDGAENPEGAAFLDARSAQDPRSENWIIHGHNMRSGAVFGTLKNFRDPDFLKAHPLVTVTLLHEKQYYVPYAILDLNVDPDGDGYFKITEFDFASDADFDAYTGYLTGHSYYTLPIDTRRGDELLMLSTCSYGYSNGRLEICCRKLRDDETPDAVTALMQQAARSANPIVA